MSGKEKKAKVDDLNPRKINPAEAEKLRGGMMSRGLNTTTTSSDATDSGDDGLKED